MNIKKRGLGRGLSDLGLGALLGDLQSPATSIDIPETMTPIESPENTPSIDGQLKRLPIDVLTPGKYQPRKIMAPEALEELANSIRKQGVIQPIVVRPIDNHRYEIIAGERRWRAAQLAELNYIPAIVREISDEAAMLIALIENIQRRDLNVIEEANALNRLMSEFKMTHQDVADAVGKSRTAVTNILRLLKLNSDVRGLVENGLLEMGHARTLLTLDEEQQSHAANIIIARALSVRETEDLIRKMMTVTPLNAIEKSSKIILHTLQDSLMQKLG
ncbi:MAG: ParB/RepB/Spo0J family partition protein, partial [Gammaproteobacteria bacterium]|nr:ParB/RepB/Spo0J family partition protein [Gammaproteobacteria bacterium]